MLEALHDLTYAHHDSLYGIKSVHLHVLSELAFRANEKNNFECWPGVQRLAVDTRLDRKTVIAACHELKERGIIQDYKPLTGHRNGYKVLLFGIWQDYQQKVKKSEYNRKAYTRAKQRKTRVTRI